VAMSNNAQEQEIIRGPSYLQSWRVENYWLEAISF
jgi:hypothetical protein